MRSNVTKMVLSSGIYNFGNELIEGLRPTFNNKDFLKKASSILDEQPLFEGQKDAIRKCLLANQFGLVRGMPGTGKTTVIA